jgi:hypothetical protein
LRADLLAPLKPTSRDGLTRVTPGELPTGTGLQISLELTTRRCATALADSVGSRTLADADRMDGTLGREGGLRAKIKVEGKK